MKLSVSNIAWRSDEAEEAYQLLVEGGAEGLEVAPGILFAGEERPLRPSAGAVSAARRAVEAASLIPVAMQAVHFGISGASLFGDEEGQGLFLGAVRDAARLSAELEIPVIVLGSPKQRLRGGLSVREAEKIAAERLLSLEGHLLSSGVHLALEPTPELYGADFLTGFEETLAFVERLGSPAIGVNYDLGERVANGRWEEPGRDLEKAGARLLHRHASLPGLLPLTEKPAPPQRLMKELRARGEDGWLSIEMRRDERLGLEAVSMALSVLNAPAA